MFWNQKCQGLAVDSEPEEAPTQLRTGLGRAGAECDPFLVIDVLRVRAEVAERRSPGEVTAGSPGIPGQT